MIFIELPLISADRLVRHSNLHTILNEPSLLVTRIIIEYWTNNEYFIDFKLLVTIDPIDLA